MGVRSITLSNIREHFAANGLTYTNDQVATFVTALQTKGFVVLSGISGTGKSKIATGFVEMLPYTVSGLAKPNDTDLITFHVRPYMIKRHNIELVKSHLKFFKPFSEKSSSNVPVSIGEDSGTGNLRYEMRNGRPVVAIWMHKSLHKAMEGLVLDTVMFLDPAIDDDHEVTSIRISTLQEYLTKHPEEVADSRYIPNHLFLSVRTDWRDSTSLLGYYNPLTETYEWTEFLKFIIRAAENYRGPEADRIAWFVILDEMNLAHVEYYFADLLSVLESGRHIEGKDGGFTREPLHTSYPELIADDDVPEREIYLPPNLYIIGTVNMDETTHAFSPKLLDRAFTIELSDVDFATYEPGAVGVDAALDEAEKSALLAAFSRGGVFHRIDKGEVAAALVAHPEIRDHLQALNTLLRRDRFHFGYRVFDEIAQYLFVNDVGVQTPFAEAFDQAVFMKVLPKFSGSRARLRSPLLSVLAWALYGVDAVEWRTAVVKEFDDVAKMDQPALAAFKSAPSPRYPRVAERAFSMLVALETDGFVSFG